ncbi:MAG: division/cell wall cluster transcriptional repressor MraZ [Candidatus Pacebacteria bacterium]|nr:division/cell wall cluster transcriptional repressor MraZ [Candidatus Paceibacterota bacterium]
MFIGEYKHTIDPKNRMTIPSKFQGQLSDGAIITRGLDNCLFIFTNEEWKRVADQIKQQSFVTANARAFSRLMLAGAMDVKLDNQGRILIPSYLSDYAKLGTKIVVAGLYDRLEI